MARMSHRALAVIAGLLALTVTVAAVPPDMAMYVSGTIPAVKPQAEGRLSTANPSRMTFEPKGGAPISIPYASITSVEYGQKPGHRAGLAILLSPLALFAKKRHHYLALTYHDGPVERTAEFELGKGLVRTTLKVLEVRTGRTIAYRDAEACRYVRTPQQCGGEK
jgi:hypothetical protein